MTRAVLVVALPAALACATAPSRDLTMLPPSDSLGTVWGDEYEEPFEAEDASHRAHGISAEWVDGDTQSARLDAYARGARVRIRSSPRGDTAALQWEGTGVIREVAVGHVAPFVADGALAGDMRASSDLRAPGTTGVRGLRMLPSTSPWSAARGAGVVGAAGAFRIGLGAVEAHDDPSRRFGFGSVEHRAAATTIGIAAGARTDRATTDTAVSCFAARHDDLWFASAEVAAARGHVRAVARLVAGERREWSAIAIAGSGPARDEPLAFSRRERWGAALERRDTWARGASRGGVSSLTRRDDTGDIRRRRIFWDGMWRINERARVELAARVTREESETRATGWLSALPVRESADDWRARVTLRTQSPAGGGSGSVSNAYRLEWVQNRSGRPGTVATWTCRMEAGPLDARVSTTAHALLPGQLAYEPDAAPLAAEYAAIAGKGATITTSVRVWLQRHAWLGATWSRRPPADARLWIVAGARL
jgi:hypothetical protein